MGLQRVRRDRATFTPSLTLPLALENSVYPQPVLLPTVLPPIIAVSWNLYFPVLWGFTLYVLRLVFNQKLGGLLYRFWGLLHVITASSLELCPAKPGCLGFLELLALELSKWFLSSVQLIKTLLGAAWVSPSCLRSHLSAKNQDYLRVHLAYLPYPRDHGPMLSVI